EGITIGYQADFESDPHWLKSGTNNSWERGVPTYGPDSAISGENVYGTNLNGPYDERTNAALYMPPIDVPAGESYLQLKHGYEFEYQYPFDHGQILVSTDQTNWSSLAVFRNINDMWQHIEIDLSDYADQRIYIAYT